MKRNIISDANVPFQGAAGDAAALDSTAAVVANVTRFDAAAVLLAAAGPSLLKSQSENRLSRTHTVVLGFAQVSQEKSNRVPNVPEFEAWLGQLVNFRLGVHNCTVALTVTRSKQL